MNKKTITLVLIVLIVINTLFWLNLTIKTFAGLNNYFEREMEKKGIVREGGGKIDWGRALSKQEQEKRNRELEIMEAIRNTLTYRMIKTFEGSEFMLITFLIITDVVLIAIYFMMSPLYKNK